MKKENLRCYVDNNRKERTKAIWLFEENPSRQTESYYMIEGGEVVIKEVEFSCGPIPKEAKPFFCLIL